ncbi:MAG TPA: type I polyketide synthase, partial [Polyangiaceae bacterium]|nr:type I polyketide synthase [Polyangiaceae bacterium]
MSESQDVRALLARAVVELKDMRRRVEAAERSKREPIAIVGMACRFPGGGDSPEGFWRLLDAGADTVTEVPAERWDVEQYFDPRPGAPGKTHIRWGSFLRDVDRFEPSFFDLSPREAAAMDPQQRLLLEVAYHALEDAGLTPERVRGGRGGVFVGVCNTDFQHVMFENIARADTHSATGVLTCVLSGRVSYAFDLRGPSVPVDTGCSASLVAVHLAVQSLRAGESDVALAGGVNLLLSPLSNVLIARLQALSPDGRCKTLDAGANGFARGEGCGVVVLKRLSSALADGDRIYAVIRGSAVNQDGKSSGLTAPNVLAQQAVIRAALENAGVSPAEVGFVEMHGTGTPLGDPIEYEALREVYGAPRPDGSPCALGAVKTNVGHTESAAGVAGLIKAVLALRRGAVPRNVHFRELNPRIDLEGTPFVVPRETTPWPASGKPRRAGVSSFGIGGTNAHVIVEEAEPAPKAGDDDGPGPYLLPVSARSRESLAANARAYAEALRGGLAGESLRDICFTASVRRPHYECRFAAVGATAAELAEQLAAADPEAGREAGPAAARRVVFLFSGQGSQSVGMVRAMLEAEPAFRASMEACDAAVRAEVGWSVLGALADDAARLDKTPIVQPILFSIQVSLAALFRARGVVPDAVIGQSMGEVAAAHVAGALSLADAARVICRRSALMQKVEGRGLMALAEISPDEAESMIAGREHQIAIGSYLGPKSVVFAGEGEPVREVQRALEARGVFCRLLKVDTPSHCPVVDGLMGELHGLLAGIRPEAGVVPMYSTVTGELVDGERLVPAYWGKNLRDQVRLMPAVERAMADGHDVFVEISPHPVILPSVGQIAGARGAEVTALPALRRDEERGAFAATLGALYELGRPVDFASLYPAGGRVVSLPGYTWQRERYELAPAKGRARPARAGGHDLLGARTPVAAERETYVWPVELGLETAPYLNDHRVLGSVVVPGALYVDLALSAGAQIFGQVSLEDVAFERVLPLPEDGTREAQITLTVLDAERASFTVATLYDAEGGARPTWTRHASGTIRAGRATASPPQALAEIRARAPRTVEGEAYYRFTSSLGIQLGPLFRGVERLECNDTEGLATIRLDGSVSAMLSRYTLHPAFLDIVFQAMGGPISGTGLRVAAGDTCLPV